MKNKKTLKIKNKKIKEEKESIGWFKKIILGALYLGYLAYLYMLLSKWELVSGGNTYMGIFQIIIPISAIRFIELVLKKRIKISVPV